MAARKNPKFFKVFLPHNGTKELGIPPMFRKHLEGKLPRNIALIGPSGNQWNVELVRDGNNMVFAKGWKEFFADHSISTGDFMIFKYKNHSKFTTWIFDPTACEKEEAFWAKPKNGAANDNRQAFNAKPKNVAEEDQATQVTLKRKRAQRSPCSERLDNPHRTGMKNEMRKSRMVSGLNSDSGYSIPEKVHQTIPQKRGRKNKNPENDHCDNPNLVDRTENIGSAHIPLENVQPKVPGKRGRKKKQPENNHPQNSNIIHHTENIGSDYIHLEKVQPKFPGKRGRKQKQPENDHTQNPYFMDFTENIGSDYIPKKKVQPKVPLKRGRKKGQPKNDPSHNSDIMSHTDDSESVYKPPASMLPKVPGKRGRKKMQPENVAPHNSNIINSAERLVTVEEENGRTGESYTAPLKSRRRPVSQEELNRAIDRSQAFRSAYPFISLVMRDSYCYHHFQLNLPFGFAKEHLPTSNTKMTLWDPNGRSWPVAYLYYRRRAALRSGFNRFSYENNLERGDVCIFELIKPDEMRVHIYRVVEEITPLIRKQKFLLLNVAFHL
ncbi:hypothetical protein J5N97_027900 [Dioscorea zingiberensis]|uniref:TF-B3 domain-containing protein n=1 Tax=Dioscorea zingiberensis TaxID=325984 RepID=A0A9D5H4B7_9LILI|nr:hypothetical protein J5N97_027900 [Dioscorea zingiberensis]